MSVQVKTSCPTLQSDALAILRPALATQALPDLSLKRNARIHELVERVNRDIGKLALGIGEKRSARLLP